MPQLMQFSTPDCLTAVWQMSETLEELRPLLPSDDLYAQALSRFTSQHRQQEWLSVRALLHSTGYYRPIVYNKEGRPALEDGSQNISISHTRGYAAVCLSPRPVGIDIEAYSSRVRKIASRFIGSDEPVPSYQNDDTWGMLLFWSAKETLYKCIGLPGVDLIRHLHLMPGTSLLDKEGTIQAKETMTCKEQAFSISYRFLPDAVLTWTTGR